MHATISLPLCGLLQTQSWWVGGAVSVGGGGVGGRGACPSLSVFHV